MFMCLVGAAVFCLLLAVAASVMRWRYLDVRRVRPLALVRGCVVGLFLSVAMVLAGVAITLMRGADAAVSGAQLLLQVDGTPGVSGRGVAGLGLVVRSDTGAVLVWRCARAPARTNNEAEYQAVIAGLRLVGQQYPGCALRCLTDSQIVVEQLCGRAAVRADTLLPLHTQALALAQELGNVTFAFIPREVNRLADALAWEALDGRGWLMRLVGASS